MMGNVVPFAGTWIEIPLNVNVISYVAASFPSRERGLKLLLNCLVDHKYTVVPFAGTWIEIT